jgi:hypothetical protein
VIATITLVFHAADWDEVRPRLGGRDRLDYLTPFAFAQFLMGGFRVNIVVIGDCHKIEERDFLSEGERIQRRHFAAVVEFDIAGYGRMCVQITPPDRFISEYVPHIGTFP